MVDIATIEPKPFKTSTLFEAWLKKHHQNSDGIWIKFYKKASGIQTITYAEALDVALCYGWIDSQSKSLDDVSYVQKFSPRKSKSIWSKVNREHIARLTKAGRMQPAGFSVVEAAKKDGRWQAAYDSPANITVPDDFKTQLEKNPNAKAFYESLNKTNTYAILWRIHTAKKPETRAQRIEQIITMLNRGKKLH